MKFAIITDTHLKPDTIDLNRSVFAQVIEYCKKNRIKEVIHCGDVFTSRAAQPLSLLLAFKAILKDLFDAGISFTVIPGNHDKVDLNSDESYLDVFDTSPNFRVCRKFSVIHFVGFEGYCIIGLPYYKESDGDYSSKVNLHALHPDVVDLKKVLLTHVDVEHTSVDESIFDPFDLVLVGHFHDHIEVTEKIQYTGSAYQSNFGENADKGFVVLNDDLTIERIKLSFSRYTTYAVQVGETDIDESFLKSEIAAGNKVRVVMLGDKEKVDSVDTSSLNSIGVKVEKLSAELYKNMQAPAESVEVMDVANIIPKYEVFCTKEGVDKSEGVEILKRI